MSHFGGALLRSYIWNKLLYTITGEKLALKGLLEESSWCEDRLHPSSPLPLVLAPCTLFHESLNSFPFAFLKKRALATQWCPGFGRSNICDHPQKKRLFRSPSKKNSFSNQSVLTLPNSQPTRKHSK